MVGGAVTAYFNLQVQKLGFENERAAEYDRWRREDELRNIDERRQAYMTFAEQVRRHIEFEKDLDNAVEDLTNLDAPYSAEVLVASRDWSEERASEESARRRQNINATITKVEQIQDAIEEHLSDLDTLIIKIEILGTPRVGKTVNTLVDSIMTLRREKDAVATKGLEPRASANRLPAFCTWKLSGRFCSPPSVS